jgi:hypothetical protein
MVGVDGAFGGRRALLIGMVLAMLLLGLALLPSDSLNIEGNTSSPPSMSELQIY